MLTTEEINKIAKKLRAYAKLLEGSEDHWEPGLHHVGSELQHIGLVLKGETEYQG